MTSIVKNGPDFQMVSMKIEIRVKLTQASLHLWMTVSYHSHVSKCTEALAVFLCLWSVFGIRNKTTVIIILMSFHVSPLPSCSLLCFFSHLFNSPSASLLCWMPEVTDRDFLVSSLQLLNAEKVNSFCVCTDLISTVRVISLPPSFKDNV